MPDVAFDSARHAQVSGDMSAGGGELTTSATSALMIATAQIFGHWTTESAAQSMGNTVTFIPHVLFDEHAERSAVFRRPRCEGRPGRL